MKSLNTLNRKLLITVCSIGLILPQLAMAQMGRPSDGEQLKGAPGVVYEAPPALAPAASVTRIMKFSDRDRAVIRDYLKRHYVPPCPVGTSHSPTGCFSSARNTDYTLLKPLGSNVEIKPVPSEMLAELSPLPQDYRYVMVDKDILMVDASNRQVLDAVTLVYAVSY